MKIKVRIKDLEVGDLFEMDAIKRKVLIITNKFVRFKTCVHCSNNYDTRAKNSNQFVYKIIADVYELLDNARVEERETNIRPVSEETRPWIGREHRVGSM